MSGVAIWTIWEVTTGFLIMGVPAFPRVAKSLPVPESVRSFFRSLSPDSGPADSQHGDARWQVMYKPRSRRRRSLWEISDLDTRDLVSTGGADEVDNTTSHASEELATKEGAKFRQLQTV